jgi:hypothetical protein
MATDAPRENPQQGETLEAGRFGHHLQILDPRVEADARDLALRQSVASLVVANDEMVPRQGGPPVPPDRALHSKSRCVSQFEALTRGGP